MPPLDHLLAPPAQQAVIAGLFVAVGWWVVAWQNRRRDAASRAERVRDVQRALFAEIRANVGALRRDDLDDYGETIAGRIEAEPGYFPSVPTESKDAIFRAILPNLHLLPRDTIDPIVLYYSQLNGIGAAIADLRALDAASVGPDRAAALYRDFLSMKREALTLGEEAMIAIAKNVDGRGISNPDAARSGRESEPRP